MRASPRVRALRHSSIRRDSAPSPEALATLCGQPPDGHHLGYERKGTRMQDAGAFTGRDPLGATAAPLRHVAPDALPMSALSAHEPDGAHATGQPNEQAWSSPFPPSLAFMEEPWRAKPTAPLLRLLIPRLAMPADIKAQTQSRFPAYARRTTPTVSPTRQSAFRGRLSAALREKPGVQSSQSAGVPSTVWFPYSLSRCQPPLSLTYADLAMLQEKDHRDERICLLPGRVRPGTAGNTSRRAAGEQDPVPGCLVSDDGRRAGGRPRCRPTMPGASRIQPASCGGRRAIERPFGRSTGGHASDRTGAPSRRECAQLKSRADHAA